LSHEFAVIVLDVNMPVMDGFKVARLVRGHPRMERTPIIFVTGVHVSELDHLKGYEVGAIDYICVPIVPEILTIREKLGSDASGAPSHCSECLRARRRPDPLDVGRPPGPHRQALQRVATGEVCAEPALESLIPPMTDRSAAPFPPRQPIAIAIIARVMAAS